MPIVAIRGNNGRRREEINNKHRDGGAFGAKGFDIGA
jgi:hypothetical protein